MEVKTSFKDFFGDGSCLVQTEDSLIVTLTNCTYSIRKTDKLDVSYQTGQEGERFAVLKIGSFTLWMNASQSEELILEINEYLEK